MVSVFWISCRGALLRIFTRGGPGVLFFFFCTLRWVVGKGRSLVQATVELALIPVCRVVQPGVRGRVAWPKIVAPSLRKSQ